MRGRSWTSAFASGLGCVCLLAACAAPRGTPAAAAAPPTALGTQLDNPVPPSLLHLPLIDQAGRHVTLATFRGKTVLVSDMLTLCQETCAIGTASMLQAARAVDRAGLSDKVEFLSITIDPRRDDEVHLAAYRRLFGPLPNWEVLTGSPANINRLWDALGIWRRNVAVSPPYPRDWLTHRPLTTDVQHSDDLIFIGADQRFRFEIDGPGSVASASAIPARLVTFMDTMGHQNIRNPSTGSWTGTQVLKVLHWLIGAASTR